MSHDQQLDRRKFIQVTAATAAGAALAGNGGLPLASQASEVTFNGGDSLCHGPGWETLNPGFWQIKDGALRRRIKNYGDRARSTGFPFHYETHRRNDGVMPTEYDPSLPGGVIYRKDWKLSGSWTITARFTYHGEVDVTREGDSEDWKMYQPGYSLMGLAFGAKSLLESYNKARNVSMVGWSDDGKFGFLGKPGKAARGGRKARLVDVPDLKPGDVVEISLTAEPKGDQTQLKATLVLSDGALLSVTQGVGRRAAEGYVGVVGRGLADFSVNRLNVERVRISRCRLARSTATPVIRWAIRSRKSTANGKFALSVCLRPMENRLRSGSPTPPRPSGGWQQVKVAGRAPIVNHEWRRNTASILATLPVNPATKTLYYTVWKDGKDVTADSRLGTDATGPGTGLVGDVPASGDYVGRLPQLTAPYKICGLSCHAITSGLQQRTDLGLKLLGGGDDWQFRDQPDGGGIQALGRL